MESVSEVDKKFYLSDRKIAREHLLQSQIKLIESVIEEMKKSCGFTPEGPSGEDADYYKGIEDQISSLTEVLNELKNV